MKKYDLVTWDKSKPDELIIVAPFNGETDHLCVADVSLHRKEARAHLERLVACANACEGIEDPQKFRAEFDTLVRGSLEIKAQRDELLAAMKAAVRDVEDMKLAGFGVGPRDSWLVAIARSEGRK